MTDHPIDAVITWVDGDDPALAAKRQAYLPDKEIPGTDPTRFASCDEIRYCVLSILKFAPFFRKIFIVTDQQTPHIFDEVKQLFPDQIEKIQIIDHKEIFQGYDDCLPTFNSTSIGCMLHRIQDLSEQFVFFNDDMLLVRPVSPTDFFQDGKPVQRGDWMGWTLPALERAKEILYSLRGTPPEQRRLTSKGRMLTAARLAGHNRRTFIATHAPYAMRKSTRSKFEQNHPEIWRANVSHRFRKQDQFLGEAMAFHLEFKHGTAIRKSRDELVYIREVRRNISKTRKKLQQAKEDSNVKFMCIQNLDRAPHDTFDEIIAWLDQHIVAR